MSSSLTPPIVVVEALSGPCRGQYQWTVRTDDGEYTALAGPGDAAFGACRRLEAIVAAGTADGAASVAEEACIAVLRRLAAQSGARRDSRVVPAQTAEPRARAAGGRA